MSPKEHEYQEALDDFFQKDKDWEKVAKKTAADPNYQLTEEDRVVAREYTEAYERLRSAAKATGRD